MEPQRFNLEDDGRIPNSRYPALLYRQAFAERGEAGAAWLEERFAQNGWTKSWRNGIYDYHHYHSTAHEVLGVYAGTARLQLGGEHGSVVDVRAGDVLVLPAGVGHKNLESDNLAVVGAYADGRDWDLLRGEPGERPRADERIANVPLPLKDPLLGKTGSMQKLWNRGAE
jgi:uncharacterized protein YjlB